MFSLKTFEMPQVNSKRINKIDLPAQARTQLSSGEDCVLLYPPTFSAAITIRISP